MPQVQPKKIKSFIFKRKNYDKSNEERNSSGKQKGKQAVRVFKGFRQAYKSARKKINRAKCEDMKIQAFTGFQNPPRLE